MSERVSQAMLDAVVDIAVAAGDEIMRIYATDFSVAEKEDRSPLTEADMAAHKAIVAGLAALAPDIPIVSEESADEVSWEERRAWSRFWLVDPLDGTKEFIKRNGEFTVNIALIEDHHPTLGVVRVPAQGVTYTAAAGIGAFKDAGAGFAPIAVAKPPGRPMRVAGSRSHGNDATRRFVENLGQTEMVAIGSSLKFCLVAEGAVDIYPRFGPTSEWDTGAAQCVVEQAGGQVTHLDLSPLSYNAKESILNPFFLVFGDASVDWTQYVDA
ncbi:MAG: 3'(2'),5'-bisphosphate nucleotidase CysQ [Pseudomonadota bacterium]